MKHFHFVVFVLFFYTCLLACKKESGGGGSEKVNTAPTVTTAAVTEITQTTAQGGGSVADPQYPSAFRVSARGLCWNTSPNPTIAHSTISNGAGEGTFSSALSFIQPNTKYYVRAYATISSGTFYGNEVTFTTPVTGAPTVKTNETTLSDITYGASASVTSDGGAVITEQGFVWSTAQNPTIADAKASKMTNTTLFSAALPKLQAKTTYYIRAFCTNSFGTGYGNQVTITTPMATGFLHAGGVIFELDNSGTHGWVAAPVDQGTSVPWAVGNLFIVQTTATSNTDGSTNTTKIIATYGNTGTYAAKLCRDYRGGGFSDWYLPAAKEMLHLGLGNVKVGGFPTKTTMEPFAYYWSSTEDNYFRAWEYDVFATGTADISQKNSLRRVRAVRTF